MLATPTTPATPRPHGELPTRPYYRGETQIGALESMSGSAVMGLGDRPAEAPRAERDVRAKLAAEFLRGGGIEIGALHLPMVLPTGVSVRYVDRMTLPELRAHYPELEGCDLAPVDVVDDGELLSTIEPAVR